MGKCLDSWFGRNWSLQAMITGTENEEPISQKMETEDFVVAFFEVGLLQFMNIPYLAVSPDGVAIIKLQDGTKEIACMKIKKRVAETTINKVRELVEEHG